MSSSDLRFGIVGLGQNGRAHADSLAENGFNLVGGADLSESARKQFERDYDCKTYSDHHSMYNQLDLDGVFICTPNTHHVEPAVDAFEADIHLSVAKPLAHTIEGANRIIEAEKRSNAFGVTCMPARFCSGAELFKAYADEGEFGRLLEVEGEQVRRRGIPGIGSWFTNKDQAGGGALIDIGVHLIDFILYLMEFPTIKEISGNTYSVLGRQGRDEYADPSNFMDNWSATSEIYDVEDAASAYIRTENNQVITLQVAWATNRSNNKEVILKGTEGGAKTSPGGESLTLSSASTMGTDHLYDAELRGELRQIGTVAADREFARCIRTDQISARCASLDEGFVTLRIMDGIYRSSERQEVVKLS